MAMGHGSCVSYHGTMVSHYSRNLLSLNTEEYRGTSKCFLRIEILEIRVVKISTVILKWLKPDLLSLISGVVGHALS